MGTLAIYFMNVQIISRSAGRSAPGSAAYRAGQRITDERTGLTFDYTRRRCEIETEILAPAGSPAWAQDRAQLWNQVERTERRADAQLAREIVVAFPKELDRQQQRELIRAYAQDQFVAKGMVADLAMHWAKDNPHAHIMLTMREMTPDGLATKKNRDWNRPELLEQWRERWAHHANQALERAGREERIDHRSLAEQGSDRLPQVHLGPHSAALERRGISTEKGDHNRLVSEHNAVMVDLEKSREQKQKLHIERAVTERYSARVKAGWDRSDAAAAGELELKRGGRALTHQETRELHRSTYHEHGQIEQQIRDIQREGQRLDRAEEVLEERRKAAAEVERLKAPLATAKRWFSENAREEFRRAQDQLNDRDEAARRAGTPTDSDYKKQRAKWERDQARVPGLQQQALQLSKLLNLAGKALSGFDHEWEQQHDWRLREQKRKRGHDHGRDEGRGR